MEKKIRYYINGSGIISPQHTLIEEALFQPVMEYHTNVLTCINPDFKTYINPIQLRRLSRMLRIGLSAAIICLRNSNTKMPDGIIVATGYGFLGDTAKFLEELIQQDEKHVAPIHFMQSTYNALAGLVALTVKCMGYNNTHVNKGFAFETALHDAMMQLNENSALQFLIGTYDESDAMEYKMNSRANHYKKEYINNLELFNTTTIGTIQGEGAAFFSLSATATETTQCALIDVSMVFKPADEHELKEALDTILAVNTLSINDIDVLIAGTSGDVVHDKLINTLSQSLQQLSQVRFKHLCGEYCTASSFAFWLGSTILKNQQIPEAVKVNQDTSPSSIRRILILNQYMGKNYSLILLEAYSK